LIGPTILPFLVTIAGAAAVPVVAVARAWRVGALGSETRPLSVRGAVALGRRIQNT
jgi:hypothetical protein